MLPPDPNQGSQLPGAMPGVSGPMPPAPAKKGLPPGLANYLATHKKGKPGSKPAAKGTPPPAAKKNLPPGLATYLANKGK